jgi:hypothetical protein
MHPIVPFLLSALGLHPGIDADAREAGCVRNGGSFTVGVASPDKSRPWLGPPPHSHRVKAKRRALRVAGGRR